MPIIMVLLGLASFSLMDVLMKGLTQALGVYNVLFWRMGIGFVLALVVFLASKPSWPTRPVLAIHARRAVVSCLMGLLFFWGLARTPVAEAIALSFIAPILAIYFASITLGEKVRGAAWAGSAIGLVGVGIIALGKFQGEVSPDHWWGFAAILLSAVLYAVNLVMQRQQALVANPMEIAVFQNLLVWLCYFPFAPWLLEVPDSIHWPGIAFAAFLAVLSLWLMSWGYARAETQILANMEYSAFIWAAILGWYILGEAVTISTLLGAVLIVVACLVASRSARNPIAHPAETTAI